MPFDLPPSLTKRLGPLPVWSWLVVGAAGVGGVIYYMRKRNASNAQPASGLVPSTDLGAGADLGQGTTVGSGSGGGASDGGSTSPVTNNYYYDDHIPPGSIIPPDLPAGSVYNPDIGGFVLPSGDSPSNPGYNTLTPPTTSHTAPMQTIQASNGSPGTIAGMSVINLANGRAIQVPDSTVTWFEQHPPANPGDITQQLADHPNTEVAVPYNLNGPGGAEWIDVAGA